MNPYLPSPHDLLGAAGLALTLVLFVVLGAAATARVAPGTETGATSEFARVSSSAACGVSVAMMTTRASAEEAASRAMTHAKMRSRMEPGNTRPQRQLRRW